MKNTKKVFWVLLQFFIGFIFIACQSLQFPVSNPTSTLTSTPTLIPATKTPTPIPADVKWKNYCDTVTYKGQIGKGVVHHIAYSSDGKLAVVSSGGGLTLYRLEDSSIVWYFPSFQPIVQSVFINNDKEIISLDKENKIIKFFTSTGTVKDSTGPNDVMATRLSEDGASIMIADWLGAIYVYDTNNLELISSTEDYINKNATINLFFSDLIYSHIRSSPDSKLMMSAAFTGRITFFNIKNGDVMYEYPLEEREFPTNVSFSKDSRYLAIEYSTPDQPSMIKILSIANGFLEQTFEGTNPTLSQNGEFIAIQTGNELQVYKVSDGIKINVLETNEKYLTGKHEFSFDNQNLYISTSSGILIWDFINNQIINTLTGEYSDYKQVITSFNNNVIALRSDYHVEVWVSTTGESINKIYLDSIISHIAINKDGSEILGIVDNNVVIWNVNDGKKIKEIPLEEKINEIYYTNNENEFIATNLYTDNLIFLQLEENIFKIKAQKDFKISEFAIASNGELFVTLNDKDLLTIFDTNNGDSIYTVTKGQLDVQSIAITPSGLLSLAGTNQEISLINSTGEKICAIPYQPEFINSIAFSNDTLDLFILPDYGGNINVWGVIIP